jgi:cyclic pyranopterin phosphate synthase
VRAGRRATGVDDAALREGLAGVWVGRTDRYSEVRTVETAAGPGKVEMSYIGG